jgi:hypothetical protein
MIRADGPITGPSQEGPAPTLDSAGYLSAVGAYFTQTAVANLHIHNNFTGNSVHIHTSR